MRACGVNYAIAAAEKTSHMAAGLVQPLVLLPSLPPGEEGLSALRQAKQQFHEELSKAHVHLRNPFKALAGHDTPKVCDTNHVRKARLALVCHMYTVYKYLWRIQGHRA